MFICSNIQIFKCSNVPMFKCSNVQMFKCSNFSMFNCSNVQMFKYSNVQMFKCSIVQMLKFSNVQMLIRLKFCRSVPLEFLRSFFTITPDSRVLLFQIWFWSCNWWWPAVCAKRSYSPWSSYCQQCCRMQVKLTKRLIVLSINFFWSKQTENIGNLWQDLNKHKHQYCKIFFRKKRKDSQQ